MPRQPQFAPAHPTNPSPAFPPPPPSPPPPTIPFTKFPTPTALLTIRSTSSVRSLASFLSVDLALLGRLDAATRLQSLLHNPAYIPDGMYDGAANFWPLLNFAWEAAGFVAAPGPGIDMDDAAALAERQTAEVKWWEGRCFEDSPVRRDPGGNARQAEAEARVRRIFERGVDVVEEDVVVGALEELEAMCPVGGFQGRAVRVRAVDFLVEKGREGEARAMLERSVRAVREMGYALYDELPRLRYSWRLLDTGVVREMLGVDEAVLDERAEEAIRAVERRLRDGPVCPLEGKPMDEVINAITANLGDIRKPPAEDGEIADVEIRLGTALPDEFKDFLRLSNGFYGHDHVHEIEVLNGTGALDWQPPLIEEYTLELLQGSDAKVYPDIEPVTLERIIQLSDANVGPQGCTYLVEPKYMDEARRRLREYYETKAEPWMKVLMDRCVRDRFGGWEELKKMTWGVLRFTHSEAFFEGGFRAYMEALALRVERVRREGYVGTIG